jgi:hypothetical protein
VPEAKLLGRICGRKIERSPSQIKAVITSAKRATRMIGWLNLYSTQSSLALLKMIFESLVISVVVAGTTHTQLTEGDLEQIRSVQATVGRRWLRASALCSQWCVLQELGWVSSDGWIMCCQGASGTSDQEPPRKGRRAACVESTCCRCGERRQARSDCGSQGDVSEDVHSGRMVRYVKAQGCPLEKGVQDGSFHGNGCKMSSMVVRSCGEVRRLCASTSGTSEEQRSGMAHPEWVSKGSRPDDVSQIWCLGSGWRKKRCQQRVTKIYGVSVVSRGWSRLGLPHPDAVCMETSGEGREQMMREVSESMSDLDRPKWENLSIDDARRALLGKRMGPTDTMKNRLLRDSAVKKFMVMANDQRMKAGMRNLCGPVGGPPAFSLEEAMQWAREDPGGEWDQDGSHPK